MKRSGFSLIETVVALLIIGIVMSVLFKTQGELMLGTSRAHAYFERIFVIKNYFIKAHQNQWYQTSESHTQVLEDPDVTLEYKTEKPNQGILQALKNIVTERVTAKWPGIRGNEEESMITFRFNPEKTQS